MTNEEYDALLSETDKMIDRLHALYEQWFQGIERREPLKIRETVQKRVDILRSNMPRNTGLRFRAQNLFSRWVTMTHHWTKVSRQIEEGTYKRDILRAKRKAAERDERERRMGMRRKGVTEAGAPEAASPPPGSDGLGGWQLDDESLDDAFDKLLEAPLPSSFADEGAAAVIAPMVRLPPQSSGGAPRPLPPPSLAGASRPMPPPAPPSMPGASRPVPPPPPPRAVAQPPAPSGGPNYESIYSAYVDARKRNNERVDNVRVETIRQTLEKQLPELRKKHGDKAIDFEVVVRDGRVGLKPVVR